MAGSGTSAAKINAFVARGLTTGWDKAGMEPPEPKLDHLMAIALVAIRDANRRGAWSKLREEWPPAHGPLIPWLEVHGQSIPVVHFSDDGAAVARVGAQYAGGRTVHIRGDSVVEQSRDLASRLSRRSMAGGRSPTSSVKRRKLSRTYPVVMHV
jgi:hypothetical protein